MYLRLEIISLRSEFWKFMDMKAVEARVDVGRKVFHGVNQKTVDNMKGLKIVVLAKQVPDTRNVGKDAMKADGTVNRAALPAIFNPEDLNALEQALRLKDMIEGTTVHILTMGPGRAAEIIREAMYRGADGGYLLSDRAFAGSDTLATSYALSCALRNLEYDLIICGRQAIEAPVCTLHPLPRRAPSLITAPGPIQQSSPMRTSPAT